MIIIGNHRIYDDSKIQSIIKEYGFTLIEFITTTNIIASDDDGYKYKLTLSNLKDGKKPNRFMKNPFALDNFKLYLSKNHPNYILLDNEYHDCKTHMNFICINHIEKGVQSNFVDNIVNSHHACKYCSYEEQGASKQIDEETLIQLCQERNVEYIGRHIKNHETVIEYKCNKHPNKVQSMSLCHFRQSLVPCRYCGVSEGEFLIRKFLDDYNIDYVPEKKFEDCNDVRALRFDFYIPSQRTAIEFDGRQHFEPVKFWNGQDAEKYFQDVIRRDSIKNDYCKANDIKLIRIPYTQIKNIETILYDEIIESQETAG